MTLPDPGASFQARWQGLRQGLGTLTWDLFASLYAALGTLYAFYHNEQGSPEGAPFEAVAAAFLLALELAITMNCFVEGPGAKITRLRLVNADGAPASFAQRRDRWLLWHLGLVLYLCLAAVIWYPLIALSPWGARWAGMSDLARFLSALGIGVGIGLLYQLSGIAFPGGRPWHDRAIGLRWVSAIGRAAEEKVRPWYSQGISWITLGLVALTYGVGWRIAEVDLRELVQGAPSAAPLAKALVTPNFSILQDCAWAMVETVYLALMATSFAVPLAIVLSFFAARNIMPRTLLGTSVYFLLRTIFTIIRSIEPIVWAIIFVVWVGLSPFAGMLALLVHSVASLGKLYSEQVESIDEGPVEAIRATGAGPWHTVVYAVWPQVVPPFVAFTLYRWDINVRMATIVGMVGGGGIGALLVQYQQQMRWQEVALIAWLITLVVWLMDISSGRVRERIV